ncbi:MAG: polynucleotide adenylyltransferase PcnB [Oceanospirillaceae bacterium]
MDNKKSNPKPIQPSQNTPQKTVKNSLVENPYLDSARAHSINATVIAESTHQINFRDIENNAVKIVKDLHRANYESYLVGGCVRDLLLNKRPKDFDVTTGAHPEQAHKVFSRSRLIGRRFKLLHVRFGRELIEVATFRASHDNQSQDSDASENSSKQADSGMILRDNVYGTIDQDALRRDFTINALYYDVASRCIYDFTNGYEDISARQIRMIGEPNERYREDPVRMLRAVRFAAKLGFSIEEQTAKPIKELCTLLYDIAPARLFDEVLKLLQSGHGNESLKLLREYHLLETILPQTAQALNLDTKNANELILNVLKNTDRRIKQRKSVSPGFLYAVLLWPTVQEQLDRVLANKRIPPLTALHEVASKVILEQVKRTSIPKRFSTNIREIWELQFRLTRRPCTKADQLVEHPRFRAAYDLLVLREKSGEDLGGISTWWTEYQAANEDRRELLCNELNSQKPPAKKKKPAPKKIMEKAVFEKFDVVEQVKAKTRVKTPTENVPVKSTPPETVDTQNTVIPDTKEKRVRKPRVKKAVIQPKEPTIVAKPESTAIEPAKASVAVLAPVLKPKDNSAAANIPENSFLTQDNSAQQVNQQSSKPIAETPKELKIEKAATEVLTAPQDSTIESLQTPPRKPRRSRAKNDPRNR